MTSILFQPSPLTPFQFSPTLDGTTYSAQIRWNVYREDWYLFVTTNQAKPVLTRPFVASPDDFDINMVAGVFASTLVYRASSNMIEVSP